LWVKKVVWSRTVQAARRVQHILKPKTYWLRFRVVSQSNLEKVSVSSQTLILFSLSAILAFLAACSFHTVRNEAIDGARMIFDPNTVCDCQG